MTRAMSRPIDLFLLLGRTDARMRRGLEVQGLSFNDLAVLQHLLAAPGHTLQRVELAGRVGLTASGVARLLAPLEKLGFVSRQPDPRDARRALVRLTGAGADRTREALDVADERAMTLLDHTLEPEEQTRLVELLSRLATAG